MTERPTGIIKFDVLTEPQAKVVQLRLAGNSWRDIGIAIGKDEATARGHWKRALTRLERNAA